MLRVAARRSASPAPWFLCGDAQQLPFPDHMFDAVTIGYGLRNLANWQRGLEEMWRVARPGGRILVLEFGKPSNLCWRAVYFAYLRSAMLRIMLTSSSRCAITRPSKAWLTTCASLGPARRALSIFSVAR
jgi:demethylmenaquinone methyltransferase/2-methoxy-6-polyprenyl-1,4-benzoquinol methylase